MNSAVVTVLTPNGRRQNVKIQPNQTILQILDEVCQKHKFESQNYDLIHHRRVLDLSLMYRFTGLPNNAQLEMVETTKKRIEEDVTLMLQLENGDRLSAPFKPLQTIQMVLDTLCPDQSTAENSVIIYMRSEIHGDRLATTTLKSLGLSGGRALMRLVHRNPESLKVQANVSAPLMAKPVEREDAVPAAEPPLNAAIKAIDTVTANVIEQDMVSLTSSPISTAEMTATEKRLKDFEDVDEHNMDIDADNNQSSSPIDRKKVKIDEKPSTSEDGACSAINLITADSDSKEQSVVHVLGERNAIIFSLDSVQRCNDFQDNQDSFFTLSVDDVKVLLRDLKTQTQGLDDAPLMTAKMRELEESTRILQKLNRYKKAIIRIQFPDRLVLQGTFSPIDTINTVMDFLRPYLLDGEMEFHLFTTPPKQILPTESRLVEVQCVPTALLHFGVNVDSNIGDTYLKPELTTKLSTAKGALLEATKSRGLSEFQTSENERHDDSGAGQSSHSKRQPIPSNFKTSSAGGSGGADIKLPKWFKPPGK